MEDASFEDLKEKLSDIGFFINELRNLAQKKASFEKEEIINALSSVGYHGLWTLYQSFTSKIRVGKENLSIGQAQNLLSHPDRSVRLQAFRDWEQAWKDQADVLCQILNNIGAFRIKMYGIRGWKDILFEPLFLNRMREKTLHAMWTAVEEGKPAFVNYLKRKAEILGLEKLSWVDVEAPLFQVEDQSWDKACALIVQQFEKFHPKKAKFAEKAFQNKWIESEDRAGKAAGGFCVSFPKSGQSRIFMTFKGTPENIATLAHELGHAYHNECVKHLPYFHQQAQMNVAETASTFGEMIVIDQMLKEANTDSEKLQLLDDKLKRSVAFFMNLHARLLFEESFYAERKKGFVPPEVLCQLMETA